MQKVLSPSDVISSGLKRIEQFKPFVSPHNANAVRDTLGSLYPLTCSDETYFEMAKIFVSLAFELAENTKRQFKIIKYRDQLSIYFDSSDMFERDPVIVFHYGFVFERPRDSWHNHFMRGAHWAASRTTCRAGRAVGVLIATDRVPVMSAYNGVPADFPHPKTCLRVENGCKTGEGLHLCPCNHAEQNAIGMAAKLGISIGGSTMYVTSRPCPQCMGLLSVSKPDRIIYEDAYDSADLVDEIVKYTSIELVPLSKAVAENLS